MDVVPLGTVSKTVIWFQSMSNTPLTALVHSCTVALASDTPQPKAPKANLEV